MITRLPRWVWAAAGALAFVAGMVNVVGLLGFRQPLTHLTGIASLLGAATADGDGPAALHLAAVVGAFLAGTFASGLIVHDSPLDLGHRYGVALLAEAALLAIAAPLLAAGSDLGLYAAAGACGLQNAMVSTFSGTVVRTTHISGMVTDLGVALGHALRGRAVNRRRLTLCLVVIAGFLFGGVAGAVAFRQLGPAALLVPSIATAAAGVAHLVYLLSRPKASP